LKKQKQKTALSLDELGQLDEETAREEAEKIERLRIQERITQRCASIELGYLSAGVVC
jgi:hypothetical protein